MKIILPNKWFELKDHVIGNLPVYFLAGPIRGGGDWQSRMCDVLARESPTDFVVACPRRLHQEKTPHRLAEHFVFDAVQDDFPRQLAWEQYYLAMAGLHALKGCIIFWLGVESADDPHPGPEPYAMDTRRETGKWQMKMQYEGASVIWGANEHYYGLSQIQRDFEYEHGRPTIFHPTIEDTAKAAIKQFGS